jgi:predicted phage terminase large subunit-like protein
MDMAWSTRLNNPKLDAMIEVAQRSHQDDPSGHRLKQGGWEEVCIPAEFDGEIRTNSVFVEGYDPRTQVGQLICPDRFGKKELDELKRQLGEYGTAGQLQQRPAPVGGGILKTDHFQLWPHDKELPVIEYVVQSVDPAYTEQTTNDPTAFSAWGVFTHSGKRGAMLLDCWADHLAFPQLRTRLIDEWHSVYGKTKERKGKKADVLLIEAKASGLSLIQDLRQANLPAIPYNPGSADKINRAHQMSPILELDCLWIPESGKEIGKPVTWARDFIAELTVFPNGSHDDQVDAATQSIIYLRDMGYFELAYADVDEIEEIDYNAKKKRNPYSE